MGKRGNREGCIWELPDGRWRGAVSLGYENGKHVRKWVMRKTRGEVSDAIKDLVHRKKRNQPLKPTKVTVGQFLTRWLEVEVKPNKSRNTYRIYAGNVSKYLTPALGQIRLSDLKGEDVQKCLNKASAAGLSPATVRSINANLKCSLTTALRWHRSNDVITHNAAKDAIVPPQMQYKATVLTLEDAKTFLASVVGHPYEGLTSVGLSLGLRRGEVAGLRWSSIDFVKRQLHVTHQLQRFNGEGVTLCELKTEESRRTLPLPQSCINALLRRQMIQEAERIKAGDKWQEQHFVFTSRNGRPITPERIGVQHKEAMKRAGLALIRFHDLRHTAATLLLAQGVPMKLVQKILGHSSFKLTMDTYAHVLPSMLEDAALVMEGLLTSSSPQLLQTDVALDQSKVVQ